MESIQIRDRILKVHESGSRKFVYYDDTDELTAEEKFKLMSNGYTFVHNRIKNDITAMALKAEMKLTWSKGFTFTDENGIETKVIPK